MNKDQAIHLGARNGGMQKPLDVAEQEFIEEYKPTPQELGWFRTGYERGQLNDVIRYLQSLQHYMNRDEIIELRETLKVIADKHGYTDMLDQVNT